MSEHPDYIAVAQERRWGAPLNELFPALRKQAWTLRGGWAWRVLPHGALVAVRIVPPEAGKESAFTCELRIARKDTPTDDKGWQAWSRELAVFLKHMGGDASDWQETTRVEGKADVTFRFVMRGKRDEVKCARCGTNPAVDIGKFREDLCVQCAMALGNEEAAANNQERLL